MKKNHNLNPNLNSKDSEIVLELKTPIGPMTARIGARGLSALRFPAPGEQVLTDRADAPVTLVGQAPPEGHPDFSPGLLRVADAVSAWLSAFFAGRPLPEPPALDFSGASEFERRVWQATREIPAGETRSYGQIAARIGRPGATRAVGGALGRNPLVLLVPCHRVIASGGGSRRLCGFTAGLALKEYLLDLETRVRC